MEKLMKTNENYCNVWMIFYFNFGKFTIFFSNFCEWKMLAMIWMWNCLNIGRKIKATLFNFALNTFSLACSLPFFFYQISSCHDISIQIQSNSLKVSENIHKNLQLWQKRWDFELRFFEVHDCSGWFLAPKNKNVCSPKLLLEKRNSHQSIYCDLFLNNDKVSFTAKTEQRMDSEILENLMHWSDKRYRFVTQSRMKNLKEIYSFFPNTFFLLKKKLFDIWILKCFFVGYSWSCLVFHMFVIEFSTEFLPFHRNSKQFW